MWLQRILKANYGTSPSGGAGSDLGVASDNVLGLFGQGLLFEDLPDPNELYNQRKRRKRRRTNKKDGIY